ncbi:MAG TPA: hypothetical protein VFT59_00050 [Candidatus Saccharimonadales bacterium]|nr:hypothetical protein [Candidatus Saccharimonadales bacterium]
MKTKLLIALPIVLLLSFAAMAFVAVTSVTPRAHAQAQNEEEEQQVEDDEEEEDEGTTYRYVAQPGDSYSKMARKAVQTYGKIHEVRLSLAQIIFAETSMTLEAGSPLLNEGENVSIAEDKVGEWVEKAEDLTDEQEAAWQAYVAGVNFNTDNVGE